MAAKRSRPPYASLSFSIAIPSTFLTSTTWDNIAATQAITAILAVGLLGALAAIES